MRYKHKGWAARETYPHKKITQTLRFLRCVSTCRSYAGCAVLSLTCNVNWCCTSATEAPVGLEPPMSHLSALFLRARVLLCFLCEHADEINITHAYFCLPRSRGSVVIRGRHHRMSWGTKLACDGLSWKKDLSCRITHKCCIYFLKHKTQRHLDSLINTSGFKCNGLGFGVLLY